MSQRRVAMRPSLSDMSNMVNYLILRGCQHILWRRQGAGMVYTQTILLYLLQIIHTIRIHMFYRDSGLTIITQWGWLNVQVTLTVSAPRGDMRICLITLIVWDQWRMNTIAQYIWLTRISWNMVRIQTTGLFNTKTGVIFMHRRATSVISLIVFTGEIIFDNKG